MKIVMALVLGLAMCAMAVGAEEKQIEVQLTVPDSAWKLSLDSVHQVSNELWVVSTVSRDPNMMGAQVISTLKASVKVNAGDLPVRHFVLGKDWNWKNDEGYTFLKDLKEIDASLKSGKTLYKRAE